MERSDGPLRSDQLGKLLEHKYSSSGTSLIEPIFQKFWCWLVVKIPTWIAPNTLTLFGLAMNVLSILLMILHSPDGKSEIPGVYLVFAAVSLFLYQTMDALDGKQARRTNTSSPLGELFDHGCDSFSTVFVSLGVSIAVGMGTHPRLLFFEVIVSIFLFYMAHWQCYVTGTVEFGRLDVTEAQIAVIVAYLTSATFGVSIWDTPVPVLGVPYKMVVFLGLVLPGLFMFLRFTSIIMQGGKGKNGATIANTSVLFPMCPMGLFVALAVMVAFRSPSGIYHNNPCLFLISFGMVSSKITNKLVVAHMTKSEIFLLDSVLMGPLMLILNQYFNCPISNELILLWGCCLYASYDAIKYAVQVCIQIANFLNIYIFRTDKPPPLESTNNSASTGRPSSSASSNNSPSLRNKERGSGSPYVLRKRETNS